MRDLLDQLRRHRWLVALAWLVVFAGGVTWVMSMPNVFRSEGKLLVRLGRENVAPDPTAQVGVGPITILPQARETEMNSVVEALKCQALVEQVVDAVALAEGPLGACRDYLFNTLEHLEALGIRDRGLRELAAAVKLRRLRLAQAPGSGEACVEPPA